MLRRAGPTEELGAEEPSLVGLSDEVAGRADLRAMLRDLAALPTDQREALVLAELHDNSHAEVAEILGCDHNKVKSLVFQARTSLMTSRQARELRCEEVQSQLSVLRGGSLRRAVLRRHLADRRVPPVRRRGQAPARRRSQWCCRSCRRAAEVGAATALAAVPARRLDTGIRHHRRRRGIAAKLGVPGDLAKSAAATLAVTTAAAGGVATTAQVAHVTGKPPAAITTGEQAPPAPAGPADPPAAAAAGRSRRRGPAARLPPAGKRSDQPLQAGSSGPAPTSPTACPDARRPKKQRPTERVRPIHGERPARSVPARKRGGPPPRAPRPRPRPPRRQREPIRPTEPFPPRPTAPRQFLSKLRLRRGFG